jgi:aldose 1-epimerase
MPLAAYAHCDKTGIKMEVFTTMPCVQFYTGNSLKGRLKGKEGSLYPKYSGFCFETQMYTDSLNNNFPKAVIKAGEVFMSETVYRAV